MASAGRVCRRAAQRAMPPTTAVFVQAEIIASDGSVHAIRRGWPRLHQEAGLPDDPGGRRPRRLRAGSCRARHRPLAATPARTGPGQAYPRLSLLGAAAGPRLYFKALLEVTDLDAFRNAVAALEAQAALPDLPVLAQLGKAAAVPQASRLLSGLQTRMPVPALPEITKALDAALAAVIAAAVRTVPANTSGRITALNRDFAEKRTAAFPVKGFDKAPLGTRPAPATAQFERLANYLAERGKVDEEIRRLTSLFKEALALPAVAAAHAPIDCPLCAAQVSLDSRAHRRNPRARHRHGVLPESGEGGEGCSRPAREQRPSPRSPGVRRASTILGLSVKGAPPERLPP